ncbi:Kef-type K+ transport system, membrane component KefB [Saccharopolyspora antimicrobica]|uniref:Kef-type K+ transport system membrane component KefB n=1 Tax=Saccharopolyspora antimicrobica TaxID=455193 RepID=A0A1I4WU20_9PSEU|nr:cation:proton antiporter [Saccharopolyspora antimicrobica]RKT82952.1 Kef-type K+ transport system membrane component KefB [Saccharopolyspora antimicrobica]SFN17274.1 Kef-type K+ transport system, membrane component KefB [Saccharopolyspora antimicrobica]
METHQIITLLVGLALIIALARLLGALFRRLGQPSVIGEVLAGILVGPTLFDGAVSDALFPTDTRPLLWALANIGVALFMFVVGLELDQRLLRASARTATAVSLASTVVPFALGAALASFLLTRHPTENPVVFVLFLGTSMAVTAFPVLARILTDLRMTRTPLGTLAMTTAAIGDLLAWLLLACVLALAGAGGANPWMIALLVPYTAVMLWVVRPLLRRVFATTKDLTPTVLAVVSAGALLSGAATEWMGLHLIFGAFVFGLAIPRDGTEVLREQLHDRIAGFNSVLLLPVFFIVAGLKVDLSAVDLAGFGELLLILLVAIGGKVGGTFAAARLRGIEGRQSIALAFLMNTRGLTELIVLNVGLLLGIIDERLYTLLVVMAVVTTALTGPLLRLINPATGDRSVAAEDFISGGRR